jgi:hypothetical protein
MKGEYLVGEGGLLGWWVCLLNLEVRMFGWFEGIEQENVSKS